MLTKPLEYTANPLRTRVAVISGACMMVLTLGAMLLLFPPISSSATTKAAVTHDVTAADAANPGFSVTGEVDLSPRASQSR